MGVALRIITYPPPSRREAVKCRKRQRTEGERVTIKLAQTQNYAGSFRHGYAVPPPSRREAFAKPIIPQIGRENKFSAEICL